MKFSTFLNFKLPKKRIFFRSLKYLNIIFSWNWNMFRSREVDRIELASEKMFDHPSVDLIKHKRYFSINKSHSDILAELEKDHFLSFICKNTQVKISERAGLFFNKLVKWNNKLNDFFSHFIPNREIKVNFISPK